MNEVYMRNVMKKTRKKRKGGVMGKSLSYVRFTQGLIDLLESKTMSVKKECPMAMTIKWSAVSKDEDDECGVCHDFMKINKKEDDCVSDCPCEIFGCEEAVKRAWLRLEEEGII